MLAGAFGAALAWLVHDVLATRDALTEASDQTTQVAADLQFADRVSPGRIDAIRESLADAERSSGGPLWTAATRLPWIGDDLRALREVADVLDRAAARLQPAVDEITSSARPALLRGDDGSADLAGLAALAPHLTTAETTLDDLADRLDDLDRDGLDRRLRSRLGDVLDALDRARSLTRATATAARLAPALLGGDGARDYLLVFENNAEVRSTGGFAGAYAVVRVDGGRISLVRQGSAAELGRFDPPVLPLRPDEQALVGRLPAQFWGNTNLIADFPRTTELLRAMYRRTYGEDVDGVLSLDTVALSRFLAATGPVPLPDGTAISAENALSRLLFETYQRLPSDRAQNAFFRTVTRGVVDRLFGVGTDPIALLRAAAEVTEQGRLRLNLSDPAEQRELDRSRIAGSLAASSSDRPRIGLYLNDATEAKLGYFLRQQVTADAITCAADGSQTARVTAQLSSTVPGTYPTFGARILGDTDAGRAGRLKLTLTIVAPSDGTVRALRVDGVEQPVSRVRLEGLAAATLSVVLEPGASHVVQVDVATGPAQRGDLELRRTPALDLVSGYTDMRSAC